MIKLLDCTFRAADQTTRAGKCYYDYRTVCCSCKWHTASRVCDRLWGCDMIRLQWASANGTSHACSAPNFRDIIVILVYFEYSITISISRIGTKNDEFLTLLEKVLSVQYATLVDIRSVFRHHLFVGPGDKELSHWHCSEAYLILFCTISVNGKPSQMLQLEWNIAFRICSYPTRIICYPCLTSIWLPFCSKTAAHQSASGCVACHSLVCDKNLLELYKVS